MTKTQQQLTETILSTYACLNGGRCCNLYEDVIIMDNVAPMLKITNHETFKKSRIEKNHHESLLNESLVIVCFPGNGRCLINTFTKSFKHSVNTMEVNRCKLVVVVLRGKLSGEIDLFIACLPLALRK